MADFPVCQKKKDGGFGVSVSRGCCYMPLIFFWHTGKWANWKSRFHFPSFRWAGTADHGSISQATYRDPQPFREEHDAPPEALTFNWGGGLFLGRFFRISFFCWRISGEDEQRREQSSGPLSLSLFYVTTLRYDVRSSWLSIEWHPCFF